MTEREIPAENVSSLPGGGRDVVVFEELLERLLAAPIDPDATLSLVRERIGYEPSVVPLRSRRRRWGLPVLAVAAALLLSGVALAAVAQRDGSAEGHTRLGGTVPQLVPTATTHPEPRDGEASSRPASGPSTSGPSPVPGAAPPTDTDTSSPSAGSTPGSAQQPGQDQQDGQGPDQESPDPSGQDQQGESGTGDGSDVQSDTALATSGSDQGSALQSSVEGDQ